VLLFLREATMTNFQAGRMFFLSVFLAMSMAAVAQTAPAELPSAPEAKVAPSPVPEADSPVVKAPPPSPAVDAAPPASKPDTASPEKKTAVMQTPGVRLSSARTVLITRTRGGDIPYDTIRTTIDGWGRFTLVKSTEPADLIIEVASSGGNNDVRVTSTMGTSPRTGQPEHGSSSTRDLSAAEVSLTVIDGANKRVLWHATETAKYAMKQKARENNLVEACERLASKFHDRLEPASAR
jgi:hypothetical protein